MLSSTPLAFVPPENLSRYLRDTDVTRALQIRRVRLNNEFNTAVVDGLCTKYCSIFAEPPYEEQCAPDDVSAYFAGIIGQGGRILTGYLDNQLVAFVASLSLSAKPEVAELMRDRLDPSTTCYFAEDAVCAQQRRRGISQEMKLTLIALNRQSGFRNMILRTNDRPDNGQITAVRQLPGVQQILDQNGLPLTQDVDSLRLDGQMRTDRRCFFSINLQDPAYGVL